MQAPNLQQPPPMIVKQPAAVAQHQSESSLKMNEQPQNTYTNQAQTSIVSNQDGFRRNNRSNRWGNNNDNSDGDGLSSGRHYGGGSGNPRNRLFDGNTNYNNRNATTHDDNYALNDKDNDEDPGGEKSQEEVAFDISFQKWEDQLAEWKRNNANHPDSYQYNEFVTKMEGCRQQLLQRRHKLRQKRLAKTGVNQNAPPLESPQNSSSHETMLNRDISTEPIVQETMSQVNAPSSSPKPEETVASSLFSSERCDSNAAIPGLDLVSENDATPNSVPTPQKFSAPPHRAPPIRTADPKTSESDSKFVAHVTNLLGNPKLQSIISDIQKHNQETAASQSNVQAMGGSESDRCAHLDQFDKSQFVEESQWNPFRQNAHDDADMNAQNASEYKISPKRMRYGTDSNANDCAQFDRPGRTQFDRIDRFGRERPNQFTQVNSDKLNFKSEKTHFRCYFYFQSASTDSKQRCKRFRQEYGQTEPIG